MADDDVLGKADALLQRHRAARGRGDQPDPPTDFPLLTEIVHSRAPEAAPPGAAAAAFSEAQLEQIERDLRLELLALLGPEFERLVESKVHARIGPKIDEVMSLTRKVLEAEMRAAVREALAEVISQEAGRLKGGG